MKVLLEKNQPSSEEGKGAFGSAGICSFIPFGTGLCQKGLTEPHPSQASTSFLCVLILVTVWW